jgi:hypothetical protein
MHQASTVETPRYQRPEWLGYGRLMAPNTVLDTIVWTPDKLVEYKAAFHVQKKAIEKAIRLKPAEHKQYRKMWCGACPPDQSNTLVDLLFSMKDLECAIHLKRGFIAGLQLAKTRDENMIVEANIDLCGLNQVYVDFVKKNWPALERQLVRKNVHIFVAEPMHRAQECDDNIMLVKDGTVDTGKRRSFLAANQPQSVAVESHRYWLQKENLCDGIAIIARAN